MIPTDGNEFRYCCKSEQWRIGSLLAVSQIATIRAMPLERWFAEALRHSGISQAEMARRLTKKLGRQITKSAVGRMLKGPPPTGRSISGDELLAIEQITNYPAPTAENGLPREEWQAWARALPTASPAKRQALLLLITDNSG
jgi:hypothetical protein